jgi:hypothetical protein
LLLTRLLLLLLLTLLLLPTLLLFAVIAVSVKGVTDLLTGILLLPGDGFLISREEVFHPLRVIQIPPLLIGEFHRPFELLSGHVQGEVVILRVVLQLAGGQCPQGFADAQHTTGSHNRGYDVTGLEVDDDVAEIPDILILEVPQGGADQVARPDGAPRGGPRHLGLPLTVIAHLLLIALLPLGIALLLLQPGITLLLPVLLIALLLLLPLLIALGLGAVLLIALLLLPGIALLLLLPLLIALGLGAELLIPLLLLPGVALLLLLPLLLALLLLQRIALLLLLPLLFALLLLQRIALLLLLPLLFALLLLSQLLIPLLLLLPLGVALLLTVGVTLLLLLPLGVSNLLAVPAIIFAEVAERCREGTLIGFVPTEGGRAFKLLFRYIQNQLNVVTFLSEPHVLKF